MWSAFEWENKVTVHTNIGDLREFLLHLVGVRFFRRMIFSSMISNFFNFLREFLFLLVILGYKYEVLDSGADDERQL